MATRTTAVFVSPAPLAFVVDLVNEWGSAPREAADERHAPYPSLRDLAEKHAFRLDAVTDTLDDEDLARTADALYPLFGTPDTAELVDRMTELLDRGSVRPALAQAEDRIIEGWTTDAPDRLLAVCTLALRHHLVSWGDGHRLGTCEGMHCADAYVDSSSAGRRRFCCVTCQNRSRVAAFRARRRNA
jgi:predicted RNA-binding Zn ribbon-like protein